MKKSGFVGSLKNGAEIGYRTSYAAQVEFGIESDIPITGTQVVKIKGQKRKDGTIVKAHEKKYVNKRLIRFRPKLSKFEWGRPIFRVISKIKARPGQYFLSRSVLKGIQELVEDIRFYTDKMKGGV